MIRGDDVEEGCVGVHLEESAEHAVGACGHEQRCEGRREPDPEERRRAAEKGDGLEAESEARHLLHEMVRRYSAGENRGEREQVVPQHDALARLSDAYRKFLGGELWRPEQVGVVHEHYGDKSRRGAQRRRIAEVGAERS